MFVRVVLGLGTQINWATSSGCLRIMILLTDLVVGIKVMVSLFNCILIQCLF
jgi:hypothetical protein